MTKTTISANKETVTRDWYVIDATDKILGRLCTEITDTLRGKNKPSYTPHCDTGDHVVVINAEKVKVSGNKFEDKMYYRHTGYIGNLKSINFAKLQAKKPESIIERDD
jgi:large subunit ribosomal protein L13